MQFSRSMNNPHKSKEVLRARIEQFLAANKNDDSFAGHSLDELLQEISIYQQELEFQNEELRRIQEELEASRRRYAALFDHAPVGYVVFDREHQVISANQTFLAMTGLAAEKVMNRSVTAFIHPDSQDDFYLYSNRLWSAQGQDSCELQISKADHSVMTVKAVSNLFHEDDTSYVRMAFSDITKEKALLKLLDEEKNRFSVVASYVYNWEYWRGPDGNLFYVSPSCERISGYTPEEFINNPGLLAEIVHPDDAALFQAHEEEPIPDTGHDTFTEIDFRIVRKDGNIRWIGHVCRKVFSAEGLYLGIRSSNHDISERMQFQQSLERSESDYRLLFENITQGFALHEIILDGEGKPADYRFLKVNPGFERLTGLTAAGIIGKTVKQVLPGTEDHWINTYGEVALTGVGRRFENFSAALGQHYEVWAFSPVRGQFAVVFTDVTDRVKAMQEMKRAKENAERSDQLKTLFLNNLSHEIRTPLNAIVGFSEFLNEEGLSKEQTRHMTSVISNNSMKLLEIIEGIVSISSIEAGLVEVFMTDFRMEQLMRGVYSRFLSMANDKGLRFRANNMLHESEQVISSDEGKLLQVLVSLVDNAIKFTEQGFVEFGVSRKDKVLQFYVADTGVGFDMQKSKSLFERFEQLETEQSDLRGGLGLGLPISKAYVEMLGGQVWFESEPGKGSTFYFTIPWVSKMQEEIPVRERRIPSPGEARTVLIAEDEENNFELARVILLSQNLDVLHAWNGLEAVDMVRENPGIDLVLMDIKMPVMNGHDATREIKRIRPELPVLALTAYALPGDREKILSSGCDDYIAKPISLHEFLEKVSCYF